MTAGLVMLHFALLLVMALTNRGATRDRWDRKDRGDRGDRRFRGPIRRRCPKISDREWVGPRCASDPALIAFQASLSILERHAGDIGPGDGGCGPAAPPQNNRGFFSGTQTN